MPLVAKILFSITILLALIVKSQDFILSILAFKALLLPNQRINKIFANVCASHEKEMPVCNIIQLKFQTFLPQFCDPSWRCRFNSKYSPLRLPSPSCLSACYHHPSTFSSSPTLPTPILLFATPRPPPPQIPSPYIR